MDVNNSLTQNVTFIRSTFNKSIFSAMLTILSANINVFVDGILVSNKLGSDALAAINLSLPVFLFMCIIGSFFVSGTAINAARAIGDNDPVKSQMYFSSSIVSTFFISIVVTVLGLIFSRPIVLFLCSDTNIQPYVSEYVIITLIGALPKIMIYVPLWFLRLDGKNLQVTGIMSVMSLGNILLDVLFVYILDMGVFGAGLASVIATTIAFIIGMLWLMSEKCNFKFKPFIFKDLKEWKVISSAGVPSALNNLASTIRILMINSVLIKYGGGSEVAIFTAINGIAGFAECITLGIPQAASPMLGVFSGEQDNGSCKLLVKIELITSVICAGVFTVLMLVLAEPIQKVYGLQQPLLVPLLWLSLSIFPAAICSVISGYYNMSGRNFWSNGIIFFRVILMTYIGLHLVTKLGLSTYVFLLFSEITTLLLWIVVSHFYHKKNKNLTRFLFMDMALENSGNILNFSVNANPEDICSASERISDFCNSNGLNSKITLRVQLALEEIMTLILNVNDMDSVKMPSFDIRAFYFEGITSIRLRYGGKDFNPFNNNLENDDMYMGITMLKKMVRSLYQRTFGINMLQVTLKKVDSTNDTNQVS